MSWSTESNDQRTRMGNRYSELRENTMSIISKTKQIQLILESHEWKIREHALINRLSMNMYPFQFFLDVKVCIAGLHQQSPLQFAWQPSGNSRKPYGPLTSITRLQLLLTRIWLLRLRAHEFAHSPDLWLASVTCAWRRRLWGTTPAIHGKPFCKLIPFFTLHLFWIFIHLFIQVWLILYPNL
jgi:hypothetical protein